MQSLSVFSINTFTYSSFFSDEIFNDIWLTASLMEYFNLTEAAAQYHIKEALNPNPSPLNYPPLMWLHNMRADDLFLLKFYANGVAINGDLIDRLEIIILWNSIKKTYNLYTELAAGFFDLATLLENIQNQYYLLGGLLFLSVFIFLQVFFIRDVLLLFVVMDLALSVFAVLFSLTGLFFNDLNTIAFFFILLTLAACETAISLGFLVSFSRRHKSDFLTLNSLQYAVF